MIGKLAMTVIKVETVSKIYKIYAQPRDRLKEILTFGKKSFHRSFCALRDVSFNIEQGDRFAIIGENGSGKSTLLKIITGVLKPTDGVVHKPESKRISALLELGAGFNSDFTGRANVYMNGALQGFTREQMQQRMKRIEDFAEIGDFIDQQVKTYSSGMQVRLAFAAAINVDPDILIIDEALAVGDMFFQAKCMQRMQAMIASGVTLLLVTHDMSAVKSICNKAILLENGVITRIGAAGEVGDYYLRQVFLKKNEKLQKMVNGKNTVPAAQSSQSSTEFEIVLETESQVDLGTHTTRFGNGKAQILDAKLLDSKHVAGQKLDFREDFYLQIAVRLDKVLPTFCIGYNIKDMKGIEIIGTTTSVEKIQLPPVQASDVVVIEFKSRNILTPGHYSISIGIEEIVDYNFQHIVLDAVDNGVVFEIQAPQDRRELFWTKTHLPVTTRFIKL